MPEFNLRAYQLAAIDSAVNWVKYMPSKHGIIWAATAAGKSIMIAKVAEAFPDKRILVLAHRQELLEQNAEKISSDTSRSIYSAGLGKKDLEGRVVFAGIQSIARAADLPKFELVLIDECHRVSNNAADESQYWNLVSKLGSPQIIGFTATPFRLGGGMLDWGEIIYEVKYPILLKDGFVTALSNKVTGTPDLSKVQVKLGEYVEKQLEETMLDPELLKAAAEALFCYGEDRNSILIFAVSKKHCELLCEVIKESGFGGGVAFITGDTHAAERAKAIEMFKCGELRILINCMVLVEGFDAPCVDAIFCLRPTMSKALWEQMLGRGVRLFPGKANCLVIDMAGNFKEHGSLAAPYHGKAVKKTEKAEAGKVCPDCEEFNEGTKVTECGNCGYIFPQPEKREIVHEYSADLESDTVYKGIKTFPVHGVTYRKHVKAATGGESLRVDYTSPGAPYGSFSEWLSVKHENEYVRDKAWKFFRDRGVKLENDINSYSFKELLDIADTLKKPINITVDQSGQFPRVTNYEFEKEKVNEVMPPVEELLDEIPFN